MKVLLAFIIVSLSWLSPAWAQSGGETGAGPPPAAPNYSVPPLPPSVKPITPENPAGPAEPHPRVIPPPASDSFEPPPEQDPDHYERLTREDIEATLEAVDPSWHNENNGAVFQADDEVFRADDEAADPYPTADPRPAQDQDQEKADEGQAEEEAAAPGQVESSPLAEEQTAASFEELLSQKDGVEFEYQGATYVWRDGAPFEKTEDGGLLALTPPEDLYVEDDDGRQWLSRNADGSVYINVAPRIWATINFSHNSDIIEDDSKPVLDVFGESLTSPALSRHRLIIAGHTSRTGNPDYNLKLSRRRALSVSRYLIERHGIEPERLILHGYGFEKPIADNDTDEGQALNRRVEFILLNSDNF